MEADYCAPSPVPALGGLSAPQLTEAPHYKGNRTALCSCGKLF